MFEPIKKIIANTALLDVDKIAFDLWESEDVQEVIIDLNTKGDIIREGGQLFNHGIDSTGADLGDYSNFTIEIKKASGLPFDRITLFQNGIFYDSFHVVPVGDGFKIEANPIREDSNLFDDFGVNIVGLTAKSKELLANSVITQFSNYVKAEILYGK